MISNIYIKNFKILKEIDLAVRNLNVITGKNSVGKSSLIQALLLLRQSFEKRTLIKDGLLLQGDYVKLGKGRDVFTRDAEEDFMSFGLTWRDGKELILQYEYMQKTDLQKIKSVDPVNSSHETLSEKSIFNNKFIYLSADRITPEDTYPVSDYHVNTLKTLGKKGEYTAHYLSEFEHDVIEAESILHNSVKSNSLLSQVSAWMCEISDGIKISTKMIEEINGVSLAYEFSTKDGYTDKFSPINVGFGITYILPVVTALLSAKKGDLVLIENPEAHLHPAGQSAMGRLISLVAQTDVQIFIETHSDHILNGIRSSVKRKDISHEDVAVFYFVKDEELQQHEVDIITPFIDEHGKLDEWPNGFFDEWNKQLDNLL